MDNSAAEGHVVVDPINEGRKGARPKITNFRTKNFKLYASI